MLQVVHTNIPQPHTLDSAINDLRKIIVQRMQAHFNDHDFSFNKWIRETFADGLLQPNITKHLPQLSSAEEKINVKQSAKDLSAKVYSMSY